VRNAIVKGVVFVLLACAVVFGAAKWIPTQEAPSAALPDVYVYQGYAVTTEAGYDQKSLDYAALKFQQLYDSYLTGNDGHIYLSVVPDKGSFTAPPEGYTPASAQETADTLLAQLDFVQYVDIAPGLTLEDYYRTDPHWRQECLVATAQTLAQAMDVPLAGDFQENAIDVPFYGAYAEKAGEPLVADTLRYLTGEVLDACTVYDYETDAQEPLYDLSAVETDTPYDLYLQGSRSLLRIDSPLSASDKTLVVFRDSFGSSLIPLLAESYRTIYAVDIRYLSSQMVGRFLSFDGSEDVLFLYSTMVLQNSRTMK
jgi:hypothetical protein